MLIVSNFLIHSWTVFLVAVEYFQEESVRMVEFTNLRLNA